MTGTKLSDTETITVQTEKIEVVNLEKIDLNGKETKLNEAEFTLDIDDILSNVSSLQEEEISSIECVEAPIEVEVMQFDTEVAYEKLMTTIGVIERLNDEHSTESILDTATITQSCDVPEFVEKPKIGFIEETKNILIEETKSELTEKTYRGSFWDSSHADCIDDTKLLSLAEGFSGSVLSINTGPDSWSGHSSLSSIDSVKFQMFAEHEQETNNDQESIFYNEATTEISKTTKSNVKCNEAKDEDIINVVLDTVLETQLIQLVMLNSNSK